MNGARSLLLGMKLTLCECAGVVFSYLDFRFLDFIEILSSAPFPKEYLYTYLTNIIYMYVNSALKVYTDIHITDREFAGS